jgi:hypothetical protein
MNDQFSSIEDLPRQTGDSLYADAGGHCRGQPGRRDEFRASQREYDLTIEDIRAALKFAGDLVDQEQHHPLPT